MRVRLIIWLALAATLTFAFPATPTIRGEKAAGKKAEPKKPKADEFGVRTFLTDHYTFRTDSQVVVGEEFARVIEAIWKPATEFFGAAPRLNKRQKLTVYFFEKQQGWIAQMKRDKIGVPMGAGGYYSPTNRTVYLWRQPTVYNSRQLLIHEVLHQFHFLSVCGNRAPRDNWYVEGVVEYLSRHTWDGKKLALGVLPLVTLADYAKKALQLMQHKEFNFRRMVRSENVSPRPLQWALVRYLCTEAAGPKQKTWKTLATRLNRGAFAKDVFSRTVGEPKKVGPKMLEWLKKEQEPFKSVWNTWEGVGARRIKGWSKTTGLCRTGADVTSLETVIEVPAQGRWLGGLMLDYRDTRNFTVAYVGSNGRVRVSGRIDGRWKTLLREKAPTPEQKRRYRLKAIRTEAGVEFHVEGKVFGPIDLPGKKMGLALDNCAIQFHELKWE